jgi:hypothetical protein
MTDPDQLGKTCFVAMPITTPDTYAEKLGDPEHFAHVLAHLYVPALEEVGLTVIEPSTVGSELIHAEIIRNLEQADFVLCDLSSLNPNVLFELGVRTSLDRPVILVKDDLTERIPFDLAAINTLTYDGSLTPWSLVKEKPRLVNHIRSVIDSSNTGNSMWRYFGLTKRAKPSEPGENSLEAKVDLLLREFSRAQATSLVFSKVEQQPVSKEAADRFEKEVIQPFMNDHDVNRYWFSGVAGPGSVFTLGIEFDDIKDIPIDDLQNLERDAGLRGLELTIQMRGLPLDRK